MIPFNSLIMVTVNVSFGIFALLPVGWLFMALVILLECWVASRMLAHRKFDKSVCVSIIVANIVSGIVGFVLSLLHNGGWWLVVWFPWVGSHEVGHNALWGLAAYYLIAFVLSVLIEWGVNALFLSKHYGRKPVFNTTLVVNVLSYLLGSLVLYSISFS